MCTSCATGAETVVIQAVAGAAVVRDGFTRWRERAAGQGSGDRRIAAYRADAEFLAGIGLDPDRVLGPPPAGAVA